MKIGIYCPLCAKRGKDKLLLKAEDNLSGTIYPYCKECRKEVRIDLRALSRQNK